MSENEVPVLRVHNLREDRKNGRRVIFFSRHACNNGELSLRFRPFTDEETGQKFFIVVIPHDDAHWRDHAGKTVKLMAY